MNRRWWIVPVVVLVVAGAGGGWYAANRDNGGDTQKASSLPPATALVTRQDLAESQQEDGTLGYGDTSQLTGGMQGVLTWLPAVGGQISRGHTVYRVDNNPVILFYGDTPFYRVLKSGVSDGPDVAELEQNLHDLGYGGFSVDDHFTDNTASAVEAWQADHGLDQTGAMSPGQIVMSPAAIRIDDLTADLGGPVAAGKPIFSYTGTTHTVTVPLDVADQQLAAVGGRVTVQLPDGSTVSGTITTIGTVAQSSATTTTGNANTTANPSSTTTVNVTVTLTSQTSAGHLDQAPVEVNFVSQERRNVLTVPISALLALSEGGYGVQVVNGDTSRVVAVQAGIFSDTRVEVSGGGLTADMKVGVPKS
jgi:peptidoglycan hydrolase-like protein with peptidoglycan-binding domain